MNHLFTITLILAIIVLVFAGTVLLQLIIAHFRKDLRRDNALNSLRNAHKIEE